MFGIKKPKLPGGLKKPKRPGLGSKPKLPDFLGGAKPPSGLKKPIGKLPKGVIKTPKMPSAPKGIAKLKPSKPSVGQKIAAGAKPTKPYLRKKK